ncbi:MAG: tetratricopeptide repeat protein [Rhodospirillales bacterium]
MLTDRFGLPLTMSSAAARDAYVAGVDCVISADTGAIEHLSAALAADPDFAMAHAALARWYFLIADIPAAKAAAKRARELSSSISEREQSHINALCLPLEGRGGEAWAATQAHVASYPRDAMIVSLGAGVFSLIGFSGRQEREAEQIAFLDAVRPHLADDWWFQSFYAFALGEFGRHQEALAIVERSMVANPRNAHGAHIKAHVLYELGEDEMALHYLDAWLPNYGREGLMHCHLSWHVALSALALGDTARAWQVYEQQVQPGGAWGPPLNVATDAPAFLWRAELAGEKRNLAHWHRLRDYTDKAFPKSGIGFVDVHRALTRATTANGMGIAEFVAELEEIAPRSPMGTVVPQLARGFAAYEAGDWPQAIAVLQPALAQTVRIGGSRAQRDLVLGTLIAAYLRSGQSGAAATSRLSPKPAASPLRERRGRSAMWRAPSMRSRPARN